MQDGQEHALEEARKEERLAAQNHFKQEVIKMREAREKENLKRDEYERHNRARFEAEFVKGQEIQLQQVLTEQAQLRKQVIKDTEKEAEERFRKKEDEHMQKQKDAIVALQKQQEE